MPLPPSPVELAIESLGGLGDGIGTLDGKPLFVPKSCPGDRLRVHIVRRNHDGLHGLIAEVLAPGPGRTASPCPHFTLCGGCALQQLAPADYRAFKTRMLHSALAGGGFPLPEAGMIFIAPGARRRVEFSLHHDGGTAALAFHELRSHRLVAVDNCMVLEPPLQALMAPLNEALSALPFKDTLKSASLTAADSGIDLLLTLTEKPDALPALEGVAGLPGIARVAVRLPGGRVEVVSERVPVEMMLGGVAVPLPPDAFLQATREGQRLLTGIAVDAAATATSAADLFCGIGSYAFPLAARARVHAIEGDAAMVHTLQRAVKRHAIAAMTAEQRDLFKRPLTAAELKRFDVAVINPPRPGAKAQTEQLAASGIGRVVMISCNPATFARDAKILKNAGFRMISATGVDQFVWSPFLEIAAVFER